MVKSLNDVGSEDRGGTTITRLTGGYPLFVHPLYREQNKEQYVLVYCTEKFTLVQDRVGNEDPLSPVVLVQFP